MTKTSKSLFSAHYLQHHLLEQTEWQEDISAPFAQLQALYHDKQNLLPHYNEAQTEKEFVQPILGLLGFASTVQPGAKRAGQAQRPDYALFANPTQKAEADQYLKEPTAFYPRALAIAEAKYWERPLTQQQAEANRGDYDNRNPSFQIVNYLMGTGVDWGVLTNGRVWRLYYRHASSTANEFYEVDLLECLADSAAFKRFWLFFRRPAFERDAQGRNFLERVREGSTTYARQVSDQLKGLVFDEIFPLLAGGLVADGAAHGKDVTSPAAAELIYEATLSLLYKLLFLLYAEARYLLPIESPGYRRESITQMAQEVAGRIDRRELLGDTATTYYRRLLSLFEVIDRGDRSLGLPRYNGGLFHFIFATPTEQEKHRANYFLTQHKINDRRLAEALDKLARIAGETVDYSFLEVRHLGAVYEGLLQYKLVIDDAPTGKVHLENDKGERKATGSYYTPDYIVKYIVRQTLAPILKERAERFKGQMAELVDLRRQLGDPRQMKNVPVLRQQFDKLEVATRETLLDIKVCDPAMGSGHFLVEAVDYLTDNLITILSEYPEHNPVLTWLAQIRGDILNNMQEQGISLSAEQLTDTQLLQRAVMKRCIYGVDLNYMAVELAKVSLWLHSFTVGAPLSFLDHHLRWGNSLVGVMARQVADEMGTTQTVQKIGRVAKGRAKQRGEQAREVSIGFQGELFGGPFRGLLQAANQMQGISLLSDATLNEVEQSESLFSQFDEKVRAYKKLLDVYVAQHFGVKGANDFLRLSGAEVMDKPIKKLNKQQQMVLAESHTLFKEKRFFHWDLEFPEVFIDLARADWKTDGGFDVVMGNPPYVRVQRLGYDVADYLFTHFETCSRKIDLSVAFLELGTQIVNSVGLGGFISTSQWMATDYGESARQYMSQGKLVKLVDFGSLPVFEHVSTYPAIFVLAKTTQKVLHYAWVENVSQLNLDALTNLTFRQKRWADMNGRSWILNGIDLRALLTAHPNSKPLSTWGHFYVGALTGKDEVFVISRQTAQAHNLEKELLLPYAYRGEEIDRYSDVSPEAYILYPYWAGERGEAVLISEPELQTLYPNSYRYLLGFREALEQRQDSRRYYAQGTEWYRFLRPGKFDYIQPTKLVIKGIALGSCVGLLPENHAFNGANTPGFVYEHPRENEHYLLALLNSSLISTYLQQVCPAKLQGYSRFNVNNLNEIPVYGIEFTTLQGERETAVSHAKTLYQQFLTDQNAARLLAFADENLGQTSEVLETSEVFAPARTDIIHDLLAFLAEEMIRLNREKQAEAKGFLHWLAEYTERPIAEWQNKTAVQNYYAGTWETFREVVRKNGKRVTAVDVQSRDALERLQGEFERSMAKLTPLLRHIQAADRLIDEIVYRLYGLTAAEIAIVEGQDGVAAEGYRVYAAEAEEFAAASSTAVAEALTSNLPIS